VKLPGQGASTAELLQTLAQEPLVAVHLATALLSLALGAVVLARSKGTPPHRALGWTWVGLMATTTVSSAFIRDFGMPNIGGITPIHLFTAFVAVQLPLGIWRIRHGQVEAHRKTMRGLYWGGCITAGIFTLLPGRFLGRLLWGALPGIGA
jgi:uncharacterized membrane protein